MHVMLFFAEHRMRVNFESLRGAFDSMRPSYFFLPLFTFLFLLSFLLREHSFRWLHLFFHFPSGQKRLLFEKHRNTVKKVVLKIKKKTYHRSRRTSMIFT